MRPSADRAGSPRRAGERDQIVIGLVASADGRSWIGRRPNRIRPKPTRLGEVVWLEGVDELDGDRLGEHELSLAMKSGFAAAGDE
ncbi:MAG: hypothetical protein QOE54_4914 [Streptosporangiaceae bacterium]|nr:hypothetical protein [Streptosporangiaceae bacterium]